MIEVLYFGAWGGPGHYLWDRFGHRISEHITPWGTDLDLKLCPGRDRLRLARDRAEREAIQLEGEAALRYLEGWTALSFWDRSEDHRLDSNSAFVARGAHTANDLLAAARIAFPGIVARFTFQIVVRPS